MSDRARFINLPEKHRRDTPLLVAASIEKAAFSYLTFDYGVIKQNLPVSSLSAMSVAGVVSFEETVQQDENGFAVGWSAMPSQVWLVDDNGEVHDRQEFDISDDYPQSAPLDVILSYDEDSKAFSVSWHDENFARTGFDIEIKEDSGEWKIALERARVWEYTFTSTARRVCVRVRSRGIKNASEWTETNHIDIPEEEPTIQFAAKMTLENVDFLRLLPRFMQSDKAVIGLAQGVGQEARELDKKIQAIINIAGEESITEDVLDAIAEDRNIFWYEKAFPREKKLEIISTAGVISASLGTKWAIEKVLSIYFSETKIQEWFEYDGAPFHYKIISADDSVIRYGVKKLEMLIGKIKRLSVRLDEINASLDGQTDAFFGVIVQDANFETYTGNTGE